MIRRLLQTAVVMAALAACAATGASADPPLTADSLLDDVLARLPRSPVQVSGTLAARATGETHSVNVDLDLAYGADPATARYTVRDAFGRDLEQLTVTRPRAGRPRYAYAAGSPLAAAPAPDLSRPIQGTDIEWADLSFAFLWWRGGELIGREIIKGQSCFVLRVPRPAGEPGGDASMALWLDEKFHMLLQAEAYDGAGTLRRRLKVRTFKRFGEQWMVKEMEVERFPARTRTLLRIADLQKSEAAGGAPADDVIPGLRP